MKSLSQELHRISLESRAGMSYISFAAFSAALVQPYMALPVFAAMLVQPYMALPVFAAMLVQPYITFTAFPAVLETVTFYFKNS